MVLNIDSEKGFLFFQKFMKEQYQTLATRSVEILFGQIELKRSQIHEIVPFELASGESIQKIR